MVSDTVQTNACAPTAPAPPSLVTVTDETLASVTVPVTTPLLLIVSPAGSPVAANPVGEASVHPTDRSTLTLSSTALLCGEYDGGGTGLTYIVHGNGSANVSRGGSPFLIVTLTVPSAVGVPEAVPLPVRDIPVGSWSAKNWFCVSFSQPLDRLIEVISSLT